MSDPIAQSPGQGYRKLCATRHEVIQDAFRCHAM